MPDFAVLTPTPAFLNDILDEVRIFCGRDVRLDPRAENVIEHTEALAQGRRQLSVSLQTGSRSLYREASYTVSDVPLEEKRLHKRALKTCVYSLMKELTGIQPPWGSLTGIRPTRLFRAALGSGSSLDEAEQALTETFDVTPQKASLVRETVETQLALTPQQPGEIDLYVGIPFCPSRCAYCSFLSGEIGKGAFLEPYLDALTGEILSTQALLKACGLRLRALYMGGGTPTAPDTAWLDRLLNVLTPLLETCREVTVEAGRPDTLDREKLQMLWDHGIRRISINPQTAHDATLRRIGRRHTWEQTVAAYALAREIGFPHINMDLIAGLPGEDEDMFLETLEQSRELHPESLTVHTLCIKHSSLLNLWKADLPDGDMTARMVDSGRQEAAARGMRPYYLYRQKYMAGNLENVGYALPGHESLYNIGMMEENADVLAVGAGGISKKVNTATGKIVRAPNVSDVREYLERWEEMARRKTEIFIPEAFGKE